MKWLGALAAVMLLLLSAAYARGEVSFSREIAPILTTKCLACHGEKKNKGGYRVGTYEQFMGAGESKSPAILSGKPGESEVYKRIISSDEEERMPQKDEPLPAQQIKLMERWIAEGAKFDGRDAKLPLTLLVPALHPAAPETYPRGVPITALAFSPDGKTLAASGYHEVTLWDAESGKLTGRFGNIARQTQGLVFSRDGTTLAVASGNPGRLGELKILDVANRTERRTLDVIPDAMLCAAWSADGRVLAAGGADNITRIYEMPSGKRRLALEQHADWVTALCFNADGAHLASASRDKTAKVVDVQKGEVISTYTGHSEAISAIAFSADGKTVYTGGKERKIHVWRVEEAKKVSEIGGFEGEVLRMAVAGEFLFVATSDGKVRQYATGSGAMVRDYGSGGEWAYSLAVHEATHRIAAGFFDGGVKVWDLNEGKLLREFMAAPGR